MICQIEGCGKPVAVKMRGWCAMHYARWQRHGDPLHTTIDMTTRAMTTDERFWYNVKKTDGCWYWLGRDVSKWGHGRFKMVGGERIMAYRYSYELHKGPIDAGLDLDHLCFVPSCVNPDHLEPVTRCVNVLRGTGITAVNARKTRCLRGHPFDEVNTAYGTDGKRMCRECRRVGARRRYAEARR